MRKKVVGLLILIIILILGSWRLVILRKEKAPPKLSPQQKQMYENSKETIAKYQKIIQEHPNEPDRTIPLQYLIVGIYIQSGLYQKAIKLSQELVDKYRGNKEIAMGWPADILTEVRAQETLADIYKTKGEFKQAREQYQKMIDILNEERLAEYPEDLSSKMRKARTMMQGKAKELSGEKTAPELLRFARNYKTQEKYKKAIKEYQKVIQKYPDKTEYAVEAYFGIARIYQEIQNYDQVIKTYQEIIEKYSDSEEIIGQDPISLIAWFVYYGIGESYEEQGEFNRALIAYQTLLDKLQGMPPELLMEWKIPQDEINKEIVDIQKKIEEVKKKI